MKQISCTKLMFFQIDVECIFAIEMQTNPSNKETTNKLLATQYDDDKYFYCCYYFCSCCCFIDRSLLFNRDMKIYASVQIKVIPLLCCMRVRCTAMLWQHVTEMHFFFCFTLGLRTFVK